MSEIVWPFAIVGLFSVFAWLVKSSRKGDHVSGSRGREEMRNAEMRDADRERDSAVTHIEVDRAIDKRRNLRDKLRLVLSDNHKDD